MGIYSSSSNNNTNNVKSKSKKSGAARKNGNALEEDDVDDILDALAAQAGGVSIETAAPQRNESENALFGVQLGFINADREMKRIFGVRRLWT